MSKISILLVDDHRLVRAGIRSLLENIDGITVAAEADNGVEALDLIQKKPPDVVLMDIVMQGPNGLKTAEQIQRRCPDIKIIIFSMYANKEYVLQAARSGASAYVLKDSLPMELEMAIRSVYKGQSYLSPALAWHLDDEKNEHNEAEKILSRITARQKEVWMLIAEGLSTKEIAAELDISPKTVESHRAQLMERLETWDIPGLVKLAIKVGLVSTDDESALLNTTP